MIGKYSQIFLTIIIKFLLLFSYFIYYNFCLIFLSNQVLLFNLSIRPKLTALFIYKQHYQYSLALKHLYRQLESTINIFTFYLHEPNLSSTDNHPSQIIKGKVLQKIMLLRNTLVKETDAYEKFGHDKHIRIDILCVHPSYQEKGVDIALLDASIQLAITLKMPAIAGIFTSGDSQTKAQTVGFEILWEIRYSQWIVDDYVVFDDRSR